MQIKVVMRSCGLLLLALSVVEGLVVSCYAESPDNQKEKLKNEIRRLTVKLNNITNKTHRIKIKQMIYEYRERLAEVEKKSEVKSVQSDKRLIPKLGFGAGAGLMEAAYRLPYREFVLEPALGYALGNSYSVFICKLGMISPLNLESHLGLSINYASYSTRVEFSGVGRIGSGGTLGAGLVYGRKIKENIIAEIGYSTNLGLQAGLGIVL
ncbi:MAG: hypothetical protein HQ564_06610 [Candidatus Saganbacteria bacterium]|nr:hypothetical protein [Candidatus Saganbacteria bacterium]